VIYNVRVIIFAKASKCYIKKHQRSGSETRSSSSVPNYRTTRVQLTLHSNFSCGPPRFVYTLQ